MLLLGRVDKALNLFQTNARDLCNCVFSSGIFAPPTPLERSLLFRKQKYYSPTEGKTYLAEMPPGYEGQFSPNLKALSISLYYGSNMTEDKQKRVFVRYRH
ncbi:MAG: hypothetical protein V7L14_23020 [Nostoc sp.]|uniref:hypothetical protein n=1 Tax=Nostoc sp. TaxID=1180 RepID=UPI002FF961D3